MRAHPIQITSTAPGASAPGDAGARVTPTPAAFAVTEAADPTSGTELLAALPDAIVVIGADGRVRECNDAARALLGPALEDAVWREVIARAFDERGIDDDAVLRDSSRRVSVSISALSRRPGQVVVLRDVTDERRRQAAIARRERLAAMGEMMASMAHQLRTPLASALLDVDRLARVPGAASETRVLARLRASLTRLDRLANDMLRYARGGAGPRQAIALAGLIEMLRDSMAPQLEAHGASWAVRNRLPHAVIDGNADALLGALQNLVANALEACGRDAVLVLEVERRNGFACLALHDNGPGMTPAARARAIEPFYTTRARGTGLGLAVAQAVAHDHGGALTIESRPGEGCTVTLALPLAGEVHA